MRRYLILISALLMQACLGATYSWSVFVEPLKALTGLSQGPVQLPFTIFYFAFPATTIFAGQMLPRFGPRRCAVAGGLLFGSGWLLASLGQYHFAFTVLGIGLVAGVGVGCAYVVPIAVCIQWFPRRKGLVTGIAVAGFGGGAALIGNLAGMLLKTGMSPFTLFALLGSASLLLVATAGLAMAYPSPGTQGLLSRLPATAIVRRREFVILYGAMTTGLAAGFAVNANMKELIPGASRDVGVMAVGLFAIANALGRIVWGALFDRIRSSSAVTMNLLAQTTTLVAGLLLLHGTMGAFVFALLAGFNYGGVLVIYASSTARLWGGERVGQVYGILFSANIVAAPAAVLAGFSYDVLGNFTVSMLVLALFMAAAAIWVAKNAAQLNIRQTAEAVPASPRARMDAPTS